MGINPKYRLPKASMPPKKKSSLAGKIQKITVTSTTDSEIFDFDALRRLLSSQIDRVVYESTGDTSSLSENDQRNRGLIN